MDSTSAFSEEEQAVISDEFRRLGSLIYLDNAGSCLYPQSLVEEVANDLCRSTYANPHSNSTCSRATSDIIDQVRFRVLQHFNTNQDEYSVIFTSGATAALKLVAEAFDWSPSETDHNSEWLPRKRDVWPAGDLVYLNDSHTSVLGMRAVAEERGAKVSCLTHSQASSLYGGGASGLGACSEPSPGLGVCSEPSRPNSLFVYPAQCNFSGFKYPLDWIEKTHSGWLQSLSPNKSSKWYCLLDAATFLSTSALDLSKYRPDFVCLSFYKMFGYPTGLGALIVRNSSAHVLLKNYYGGGTVLIALSSQNSFVPRPLLHEKFEDGTANFLSIISLQHCFNVTLRLIGSMEKVSRHSFLLGKYAFECLSKLHHSNGAPAAVLYADTSYNSEQEQGGIVAFNLLRPNGQYIGYVEVLHQANLHNIQLRTGCFCNSGACWRHLNLSHDDVKSQFKAGHVCGDDMDLVEGRPTGAVRISFGYYSTTSHVDAFLQMINRCFVEQPAFVKPSQDQSTSVFSGLEKCGSLLKKHELDLLKTEGGGSNAPRIDQFVNGLNLMDLKIHEEPVLSRIFLYPVKSCGALSVKSWPLDSKGLVHDREWMIVNCSGVALTQKREPRMCLIKPAVDLQAGNLVLSYQGTECRVPLEGTEALKEWAGGRCQSKVCGDRVEGLDCGEAVATWLSGALGQPGLRLIRHQTRTSKKPALSLANQGQYLLINSTSVSWLSDRISSNDLNKETFIDRFRSNLVIDNVCKPFVEQAWSKVSIGKIIFKVDGGCNRCQMICIDQSTGATNQEPLTALGNAMKGKLKFGVYLSRLNMGTASLSVGDKVTYE